MANEKYIILVAKNNLLVYFFLTVKVSVRCEMLTCGKFEWIHKTK